jgi:hypothetical protein
MTLLHRSSLTACLAFAVACDGRIPLGDGESTGVDTEDGSESDATDSSGEEGTATEPTGETGLVCTPLEDEAPSDLVVVTVNNATASPIWLVSPPACDPQHHFLIESDDGARSSVDQCTIFCNALGMDWGCDAGCFPMRTILVQPGASAPLEEWYGRLWQPIDTPAQCVEQNGGECYRGTTPASGELRVSVWRRRVDDDACADGCECPDGAGSCEVEDQIEGAESDRFETLITAGQATIEITITE